MPQRINTRGSRGLQLGRSSRRHFLQGSAAALSAIALSNCSRQISDVQAEDQSSGSQPSGGEPSGTLNVYTWADYSDDELVAQFTEETGVEVIVDIYESNEAMLAKLQAGGGDKYSVMYPSDYMVAQMITLGLLSELDLDRVQGLDTLQPKWEDPGYDSGNAHSVPVSWGTTGFIYNSDVLTDGPEDWDYLWDNKSRLSRRMTLLDDMRETMGGMLKSLGYSYNETDPDKLEEAYKRLADLKSAVSSFKSFGWEDQMFGGDSLLAMVYSVDAIEATLKSSKLSYVIPQSGSSVWTDTMVIPKGAPNPDAAYAWMNFMMTPAVAAAAVERLKFATPNQAAFDLLSSDLTENENLFPPEKILANCEGIAPVGDATDLYDRYWTQIKSL
ncbi:MAG: spermidine/putrescine ABC transporter substrate-binding protein [Elainellaceae cyanobacterium]